jgi:citrate lyase gamma subunit
VKKQRPNALEQAISEARAAVRRAIILATDAGKLAHVTREIVKALAERPAGQR